MEPMSDDEKERLNDWINKHVKNQDMECPICGHVDWLAIQSVANIVGGIPVFIIMCTNCGHLSFQSVQQARIKGEPLTGG